MAQPIKPLSLWTRQLQNQLAALIVLGLIGIGGIIVLGGWVTIKTLQHRLERIGMKAVQASNPPLIGLQSDLLVTSAALSPLLSLPDGPTRPETADTSTDSFENEAALRYHLRQMRSRNPNIIHVQLLNANGEELAHSTSRHYQSTPLLPDGEFVEQVWPAIDKRFGELYIGDLKNDQNVSYVDISTVVTNDIGLSKAALVIRVDLTELAQQIVAPQVGSTGYVYIADNQGRIVLARDISRIGQMTHLGDPANHANHAHIHDGLANKPLFAVVQSLDLVPWYVVIEQPIGEAISPFIWPTILSLFLISMGTVLMLRLVRSHVALTHGITQPINTLCQVSQTLAAGQWQVTVPSHSAIEELNTLATSFNQMARNLQQSYEQLETTLDQIKANNQTLKQFLNAMPVGVTIVDAEAHPYYSNHQGQNMTNYGSMFLSPKTPTPSSSFVFYRAQTNTLYPYEELPITRALRGETVTVDDIEIHVGEQTIALEVWANPIYDQQGTVQYAIAAFQDISQRKRLEAERSQTQLELERTNQELIRATRLKDEFLANMSHELRTPLNAIMGMTEGLIEEVFGTILPKQEKSLKTIYRSAAHLLSLINDILDVAKIESGQLALYIKPVNLPSLCSSSLAFIKQQALKKQIQIISDVPSSFPLVMLDERRILQALINLLNNAVKFTPKGGQIKVSISQGIEAIASDPHPIDAPRCLYLSVSDTGIGIAAEDMDKLFQPFVQIDSTLNRQYSGTGLGLTLVQQIAELHGGSVTVDSTEGVGSCFTLVLPLKQASQTSDLAPLEETEETEAIEAIDQTAMLKTLSSTDCQPSVLLAEDNIANVMTFSSYLKSKGYGLRVAQDGNEAIALAHEEHPDIILMDIQMPGCDGLETIRRIRADGDLKSIPIIALTALTMEGDRDRCLEAGANEYLGKPLKLREMVVTIQNVLASHKK